MSISETLQAMIDNADSLTDNVNETLTDIDAQISEWNDQILAIENGLCGVSETELTTYINDIKIPELETTLGGNTPFSFSEGPNYGEIDEVSGGLTDWEVLDNEGSLVYKYEGLNWDDDSTISEKIADFAFGNNYLTNLYSYKEISESTKAKLETRKDDLDQSKTIFAKYV
jgi:hypothetical protein